MDLFSNLPDHVISHILSFLPTKEAALTSVLSKRWRNLFAFVPNLDIDDYVFLHPEEGKGKREEIQKSFMDFVDRVLALQGGSPIKKVSLKCNAEFDDKDRLDIWLANVLVRGVSELDLFLHEADEFYYLPYGILVSRTLVKLKLRSESAFIWSTGAFLPMLKTLVIHSSWICFSTVEILQPAFPLLEELDMVFDEWWKSDEAVSHASLKKLTISTNGCDKVLNPKSISFDTPSLVYFDYSDFVAEDYPKVNLTNVVDAQINLALTGDQIELARAPNIDLLEDDVFLRFGNVWKLMNGLRNVQNLYLSPNTLEVLSLCCETMPVFNNLTLLVLKSAEDRGWQAMPVFLRNCPHLEYVTFVGLSHYVTDKCGDACTCISREDKGSSLSSCPVKYLDIRGFLGTVKELEIISHFLHYFPCLKEMDIYAEENGPTKFEVPGVFELIVKAISLYNERSSCDIHFLSSVSSYRKWTTK